MSDALLVAEGLAKTFRRSWRNKDAGNEIRAVQGIDFTVHRGDVFGFLGPNGAGKSTTIRMITGLIHPSAGRVTIGGHDLQIERLAALRKTGAFVESPSFYNYLSGRKNLEIFSGLSGGVTRTEMDRIIELVGLKGRVDDPVKVYSHGMRQRLGLAACLLPKPELLVLDEPTDGLDPHGIHETRELIKRLAREEQLTIFLSSHLLSEVENLCNRIAIMDKGRIILHGAMDDLERKYRRLQIRVDRPDDAALLLRDRMIDSVKNASGLLYLDTQDRNAEINSLLVSNGIRVQSIALENAWLDRLFLERTTRKD